MIRRLIREMLMFEGGLKLPPQHRRDLTPQIVRDAARMYVKTIESFNTWLSARGEQSLTPVRPTGSSTHWEKDIEDRPDATYGDIDYLVSFPAPESQDDETQSRKLEADQTKKYTALFIEFISTSTPPWVDKNLTLGEDGEKHPWMVIIKLEDGSYVQVDTIITYPRHTEWMKGRYTPQRGLKGYVTGNLYKALGDYFTLTIGTEGVIARLRGGQRVSSSVRKDVTFHSISRNFRGFFSDIVTYILGRSDWKRPSGFIEGLDPENVSLVQFAKGIKSMKEALAINNFEGVDNMLVDILSRFKEGLDQNTDRKASRDLTDQQLMKLEKINEDSYSKVKEAFEV